METLVRNQHFDLRQIDVEVHAFRRRQLRALDAVELVQDALPVLQAYLLRLRVYLREARRDRSNRVLVVRKLIVAPLPFGRVNSLEARVGTRRTLSLPTSPQHNGPCGRGNSREPRGRQIPAQEEPFRQSLMNFLRSSPFNALVLASALHVFIFCC